MLQKLSSQALTFALTANDLTFSDTSELVNDKNLGWIGQAQAEKAAQFGLAMQQSGFNLIVLGEPGCGRTSLTLQAMRDYAAKQATPPDLLVLHNFATPEKPIVLYVSAGFGFALRSLIDAYIRNIAKALPSLLADPTSVASPEAALDKVVSETAKKSVEVYVTEQLAKIQQAASEKVVDAHLFDQYLTRVKQDILDNIEVFQAQANNDSDGVLENFLGRHRVNLMVDHRGLTGAPVIYDDDPSFSSLFGGMESVADSGDNAADFMRLRAGHLLKAHGGLLLLQLRDLNADQQSGNQILEKLQRFLRNGHIQIEEVSAGSSQGTTSHFSPSPLKTSVKVVLIATREEYYALQEEADDFARHFPIKVDFVDMLLADSASYHAYAQYISQQCVELDVPHCSVEAVIALLREMHRQIEDKRRLSTNFAELQKLLLESAAFAIARGAALVDKVDVEAALASRYARHQYAEQQLRDAILDGEVVVRTQGGAVGQINGLTHIDLGDVGFGSPVRISARCHAGNKGVINIDREVRMTGPNHDKGIFILKSWLSASFSTLAPLALEASIVFEQEYYGVEGDSASCAELFAVLSDLSGLPLSQGIAVTGALNQHGEVMPIGGINEKIEGYFRVCREIGLDGTQGVIVPERNLNHLVLDNEVITAIDQGLFHIYTINHVLEGISLLANLPAGSIDDSGYYAGDTVMGRVQRTLKSYSQIYKSNHHLS